MPALSVVGIINTNPDLVELLKARVEEAGFIALVLHIADVRAGLDLGAVLEQHDPKVIVYDVVMPYERNWRLFEHLRATFFKGREMVITTPNASGLRRVAGTDQTILEIVDNSGDIDQIVRAVRDAAIRRR